MRKGISSENKWRGRLIRYAPLVLWTIVVFGFSTGQASMEETSVFVRPLLRFLFPSSPDDTIDLYHGYVRKFAHFTEYAILAFLAFRAVSSSSIGIVRRSRIALPIIFVTLVALADELHQSFVPSRTGSGRDVLLDISGGVFMLLLCWVMAKKKS